MIAPQPTVPMFVKLRDASMTVVPPTWYTPVPDVSCAVDAVRVVPETEEVDVIAPHPTVPMFVKLRDASMTVVPTTWYTPVPDVL